MNAAKASRWQRAWWAVLVAALGGGCTERPTAAVDRDAGLGSRRATVTIRGAGATFPQPIYGRWSLDYFEEGSVRVSYRAIGSRAGIEAIRQRRVDFGASDIPLSATELRQHELCQFPVVIGAVVPVVNLPGVGTGALRLTADQLARIYLGKIERWSDPSLREHNPELVLPDEEIILIHRADASGTTRIFTEFLSERSAEWRATVGSGYTVEWPAGVGADSNAQVAKFAGQFAHTIGYVEYSYALARKLSCVSLEDRTGQFIAPSRDAFEVAARGGRVADDVSLQMTFVAAEDEVATGWPVVGASYVLVRGEQAAPDRARTMLRFFHWALTAGRRQARELRYVPIPPALVRQIEQSWSECVTAAGSSLWTATEPSDGRGDADVGQGDDRDAGAESAPDGPARADASAAAVTVSPSAAPTVVRPEPASPARPSQEPGP